VANLRPSSVLDVGCGDGYLLNRLADSLPNHADLLGVDLDNRAIAFARAFGCERRFDVIDARDIDEQFDVVTSIEVLEHVPDDETEEFCETLLRRVRPGGHLIITVPSDASDVTPKHWRHYNEGTLRGAIDEAALREGRTLTDISVWRAFPSPLPYEFARKFLTNRLWRIATSVTDRFMWNWSRKLVRSSAPSGRHVILTAVVK
jgi:SAM-dependent methyltransferase